MSNRPGAIRRSGGPKSPKGRATSSRNALKFGIYTKMNLLSDEDPDEFEQLKQALFSDLLPETAIEQVLATDVLLCIWRKYRLERYDSKILEGFRSKTIELGEWVLELGATYEHVLKQAQRFDEAIAEKGIDHFQKMLLPIHLVKRRYPRNCPNLEAFKKEHSEAYNLMRIAHFWTQGLDEKIVKNEKQSNGDSFWESLIKETESWIKNKINIFECAATLEAAVPRIIGKRIFNHLKSEAINRATDSVTKALSRALSEYYKEQERRRRETVILLKPQARAETAEVDTANEAS